MWAFILTAGHICQQLVASGNNWSHLATSGHTWKHASARMRVQTATWEERQRKSGSTATPQVYTATVARWKYLRVVVLTCNIIYEKEMTK